MYSGFFGPGTFEITRLKMGRFLAYPVKMLGPIGVAIAAACATCSRRDILPRRSLAAVVDSLISFRRASGSSTLVARLASSMATWLPPSS